MTKPKLISHAKAGPEYSDYPDRSLKRTDCKIFRVDDSYRMTLTERRHQAKDRRLSVVAASPESAADELFAMAADGHFERGCTVAAVSAALQGTVCDECIHNAFRVFEGALWRDTDGTWRWADGTPEPRVRDLHLERYQPRLQQVTADGQTHIRVPLDWRTRFFAIDPTMRQAIETLVELPSTSRIARWFQVRKSDWDEAMLRVVGCEWDTGFHGEIVSKAYEDRGGVISMRCV